MSEEKTSRGPRPDRIFLFDVDGTLTKPRNVVTDEMRQYLADVRKVATIGFVGGSDIAKQKHQLGDGLLGMFDYAFPENGLQAYRLGKLIDEQSLRSSYTEEQMQPFLNACLRYIADLDLPQKRGTFVEYRNGLLNVCPIGRNCTQEERDAYEKFDIEHKVREKMVAHMRKEFAHLNLQFSIGGQISFDVFPAGWDKTFCLQYVKKDGFKEIHFFGDKTYEGGNDYEIYNHPEVVGHAVKSPDDTRRIMEEILSKDPK